MHLFSLCDGKSIFAVYIFLKRPFSAKEKNLHFYL